MSQINKRPRYKLTVPPAPPDAGGQPVSPVRARRSPVWVGPVWLGSVWLGPAWGIAGFVLGIAVWHSLGFWDFVGKTVLKGDEEERRLARVDAPVGQAPALRTTGTVHGPKQIVAGYSSAAAKALRACSLATPSASGDETLVTPCPVSTPVATASRLGRKSDFGAAPESEARGWSFKLLLP